MDTLTDLFATFASWGKKDAFIYRTGVRRSKYSYAWLADASLRMAHWLEEQGVGAGDRVVLWGPNSPWWGVAFWGIIARGAVAVPVDFMSGRDRVETIIRLTEPRLALQSRFKPERLPEDSARYLEDLEHLLPFVAPVPNLHKASPDGMAQLIYTSGTTGNPKGVILTHGNLTANLTQVNTHIPVVSPAFTFLSLLPLSHMFEQMTGFFTPLSKGSAIVYLRTLKPAAIMEALNEEDVAVIIAVPRLLQLLRSSIERELAAAHLSGLAARLMHLAEQVSPPVRKTLFYPVQRKFGNNFQLFVSGGAPLDADLFHFWNRLGFTVLEGYGLTECSPVLAANPLDLQIAGTVGKALPGIEIRVAEGEVLARGGNVFPGYYRNDLATKDAFTDDGWFRTGDMGEFTPEGYLRIKGRQKELIVTGAGINVYPDEIEAMLNALPGIRESCVIGLDRGGGEEVHAVVLPDGSGRKVEESIAEANSRLDELHRITGFSLWPDAEFPKTTTLKIRKFQVKERLKASRQASGDSRGIDPLTALIARVTGASAGEVRDDASLVTDLGLTSIGRLELVNYLEQEFRLDLDDSVIDQRTKVSDLRRIVEKREKLSQREHFRFWTNTPAVRCIRRFFDVFLNYPLYRLFITLKVHGQERLSRLAMPVLFVSNHTSYLDQPSVMFSLPPQWRYRTATAAWAEFFFKNFNNPLQWLWKRITYEYGTYALNLFPLPQESGFRSSLRFMGRLADNGVSILVFPEGEMARTDKMVTFRLGLGIMVRELGIPVVPVRIDGLHRVLHPGARWPSRGTVTVTFGEPIVFRMETVDQIVERTRQAIAELARSG